MKTQYILSILAATAIFAGCAKENASEDIPELGENQFFATMEDGAKTILNREGADKNKIFWEDSDTVSINGSLFTVEPYPTDNRKAVFTLKDGEDTPTGLPYVAYYPSSIVSGSTLTLPSTINYNAANPFSGVFPMYAVSAGSRNLMFKNVCGLLEITVGSVGTVKSLKISDETKSLCGTFTINDNNEAVLDTPKGGAYVTVNCGDGVDVANAKFYVPIPVGTYRKLTIEVTMKGVGSDPDYVWTSSAKTQAVIVRNKIYPINLEMQILPGVFNVGKSGSPQYIHFTGGNLQANYNSGNPIWRFASKQYEVIGTQNVDNKSTASNWYDLFGWGASGKAPATGTAVSPWEYGTSGAADQQAKFVSEQNTKNADLPAGYDWGQNSISGAAPGTYKTLTNAQWRSFNTNHQPKRCHITVGDKTIYGIVALPSGTVEDNYGYTLETWAAAEKAGAVFLPAAGYRNGKTSVGPDYASTDYESSKCLYWSMSLSADTGGEQNTYYLPYGFGDYGKGIEMNVNWRSTGRSVRLVKFQ